MSSALQIRDVRWLAKLMRRISLSASHAYPRTRFYISLTSTEVKRAERIASTLGWHVQHVSLTIAPELPARVPRGNPAAPETSQ